ncbi:MAG: RDD family protein [Akkermansia sp.]|nr:RDD family protein [Akkermansia sp.]
MDIYWIADKKKCGPATVPDVLSLVQMGELTPDTRGWHAGCEQWMPLRELPALADFLQEKQEEEALPEVPGETEAPSPGVPDGAVRVYLPSPAVRLLARLVDMALYLALVYGVIYVRQIPFNAFLLPSCPLLWVAFVALEAGLVSSLGTSPGKALLGIQVRRVNSGPMTLGCALSRASMVFVCGMGMMVSLLPLFMMGYSWWMLRSRGISLWDARCATLPLMLRPASVARQILAVCVVFACFHVSSLCLQPWLPGMIEAVERESPEAGQYLRGLLPSDTSK